MSIDSKDEHIFVIDDLLPLGSWVAVILLVVFVALGTLHWSLLLIGFFYGIGDSVQINWRNIYKRFR